MYVSKVVDLISWIPEHFSLKFLDFSMILYAFYNFTGLKTKAEFVFTIGSLESCVRGPEKNSIEAIGSLTWLPWLPAKIRRGQSWGRRMGKLTG